MKGLVTYVVIVSDSYPRYHERHGDYTGFVDSIVYGLGKIHTIRGNWSFWAKRGEKMARGEACISIRKWKGRPYASKQVEVKRLYPEDGIGVERINFSADLSKCWVNDRIQDMGKVAKNDGLSVGDFREWFKVQPSGHMAIIHFTSFRYVKK